MDKKKMNKLAIIILISVIIIMIAMTVVFVVLETKKPKGNDGSLKTYELPLVESLLERKDYKTIPENQTITNIFNSIKKYVYKDNRYSYKDFSEYELFSIIGYNIKSENITNITKDADFTYGYIKKDLLSNEIKTIFGTDKIKISREKSTENMVAINSGVFENAGDLYRNASLFAETETDYQFKFYGAEGTVGCPEPKNTPIKLVEAREIDNYIVLVAKAVYTEVIDGNSNSCQVEIYDNDVSENKKVLDKIEVAAGSKPYEVDINKYIDRASNIYILLEKDEVGEYHFSESEKGIIK